MYVHMVIRSGVNPLLTALTPGLAGILDSGMYVCRFVCMYRCGCVCVTE